MKRCFFQLAVLVLICLLTTNTFADTIAEEIKQVASEVALLKLGFGSYVIGTTLTTEQKTLARANPITKTIQGTSKFQDQDVFVIAGKENDLVLGVYKEYLEIPPGQLKNVIGGLMLEYGEPTATAHGKLIYWSYNQDGKVDQDTFDFSRQSGGIQSLVTVKFSSSAVIVAEDTSPTGESSQKTDVEKKQSAYVMITSDPLSKLFLAQVKPGKK